MMNPSFGSSRISALQALFIAMSTSMEAVSTLRIANAFSIRREVQHDASEWLLEQFLPLSSISKDYIEGRTCCVMRTAHGVEVGAPTTSVFGMLQIPIHSSLLESLRGQYATPSLVQGFRIDGVPQPVTRTTFFVRDTLPTVLAIGLNRFGFDSCRNVLTKDHTPCTIPARLDMSSFCASGTSSASSELRAPTSTQPTLYDLSAITMHGGENTGHNWTYIKVRVPNEHTSRVAWFEFNDAIVHERTEEHVLERARGQDTRSAYVLMYHRVDQVEHILRPPWEDKI